MIPAVRPLPIAERTIQLRARAEELEAAFLSEMLGHAGLGAARGSFAGGLGEEQFASFLRNAEATEIARAGGIGLAESIFRALAKRGSDDG